MPFSYLRVRVPTSSFVRLHSTTASYVKCSHEICRVTTFITFFNNIFCFVGFLPKRLCVNMTYYEWITQRVMTEENEFLPSSECARSVLLPTGTKERKRGRQSESANIGTALLTNDGACSQQVLLGFGVELPHFCFEILAILAMVGPDETSTRKYPATRNSIETCPASSQVSLPSFTDTLPSSPLAGESRVTFSAMERCPTRPSFPHSESPATSFTAVSVLVKGLAL